MSKPDTLKEVLKIVGLGAGYAVGLLALILAIIALVLIIYMVLGGALLYAAVALGLTSIAFTATNSFLVGVVLLVISIILADSSE